MSETDQSQPASADDLAATEERMAQIKAQVTEELIRDWPSPWKNDAMVNAKVSGRLGGNKEFQALLAKRRVLQGQLGVAPAARQMEDAVDPMGGYANQLVREAADLEKK